MSIQSPAKCEIRSVIRYLVWKGKTPVEVYNEVKTAYGDKGMNRTSVFKWCREFKNGRTSVHDDQRSGRPSILTDDIVEKIENALRDDRRLTVDELSAMFPQISRSLLHETITETLGYRKLSARWVPKQLTDQHKLNRVEAGQEFLRRYKLHGDEFLRSIVTGDETWVEKSFQPTRSNFLLVLKKSSFVPNKVYLRGILLHYFIQKKSAAEAHRILVRFKNNDFQLEDKERSGAPKKFEDKELEQLLDEKYYKLMSQLFQNVLQLMRLSRALKEKRPLYAQRHDKVILLHDNARPRVAKPVKTYLETLKWEVLPHPPYSPDIAPSDFHLFCAFSFLRTFRHACHMLTARKRPRSGKNIVMVGSIVIVHRSEFTTTHRAVNETHAETYAVYTEKKA
ncbi:MOS1T transposase, partial [Pseudoatta argentina]